MSKKKEYARNEISLLCIGRLKRVIVAEYGQEFYEDFHVRIRAQLEAEQESNDEA